LDPPKSGLFPVLSLLSREFDVESGSATLQRSASGRLPIRALEQLRELINGERLYHMIVESRLCGSESVF
jgi:hypothetical protein